MISMFKRLAVASLLALAVIITFVVISSKNAASPHQVSAPPENEPSPPQAPAPPENKVEPQQTKVEVPVNYTLPLYTKQAALVCPLAVAFDNREGYGLQGAVDAHLSIFGHDDAVEKSGCQEWREGLPISLTAEGQKQAAESDAAKTCDMVSFTNGYIFSCDLRNASDEERLEHAEQQIAQVMQDPSKVRLLECMGVNPWKEKPAGWTPPTDQECAALKAKLGAAADAKEGTAVEEGTAAPETPSDELATPTTPSADGHH
ncbi:MAG TPA: hypothetical protein VGM02_01650 [Acidobacteriaceae bacterium]|jgi:hypothetical protein